MPEGVDWAAVVKNAMDKFNLEIAGGLGPTAGKVWRVSVCAAECVCVCMSQSGICTHAHRLCDTVAGLQVVRKGITPRPLPRFPPKEARTQPCARLLMMMMCA